MSVTFSMVLSIYIAIERYRPLQRLIYTYYTGPLLVLLMSLSLLFKKTKKHLLLLYNSGQYVDHFGIGLDLDD